MAPEFRVLVLVLASLLACACAGRPRAGVLEQTVLDAQAEQNLRCTPLHVIVSSGRARGLGSGVALSPRVVLTAGHVVPEGATSVTAFIASQPSGEAVGIERVIRGARDGWWGGDWAILVLAQSYSSLQVVPALMDDAVAPELGQEVSIAGFPFADSDHPITERDAVVLRSRTISKPIGVPDNPELIFVEEIPGVTNSSGLSGSPVFARGTSGVPVIIGVYLGVADRSLVGVSFDRPLVVQRLPVEAVMRSIRDSGSTGR